MTPKKIYYYDYRSTLEVKPQTTQEVSPTPAPVHQVTHTSVTPTPPDLPVERPNFLPTVFIVILLIAIGYLIWSLIPKNYSGCVSFPGSKKINTFPGTCTTFYGKTFIQSLASAQPETPTTNLTPEPTVTVEPTAEPTLTDEELSAGSTTKGGLSLKPTTKPTAKPAAKLTPGTNTGTASIPADWTKHRYPDQHLVMQLPGRFTSTNVTHHTDTGKSTFTIYDGSTPIMTATLFPNWVGTGDAKNQAITFMITDNTGVIKLTQGSSMVYYFEKFATVYSFTCTIDSATCDTIIKSIEFS